jgi:hypothetical protein
VIVAHQPVLHLQLGASLLQPEVIRNGSIVRNVRGCTLLMAMCMCQLSVFWCTAETR